MYNINNIHFYTIHRWETIFHLQSWNKSSFFGVSLPFGSIPLQKCLHRYRKKQKTKNQLSEKCLRYCKCNRKITNTQNQSWKCLLVNFFVCFINSSWALEFLFILAIRFSAQIIISIIFKCYFTKSRPLTSVDDKKIFENLKI